MKIKLFLPLVTISLANFAHAQQSSHGQLVSTPTKKVCIVGRVLKQGEVLFKESFTVTQAIRQAGGIQPDKASNEVMVISQMVNDWQTRLIFVDLKTVRKKPYMDLLLQDRDIINVGSRVSYTAAEASVNPCPSLLP